MLTYRGVVSGTVFSYAIGKSVSFFVRQSLNLGQNIADNIPISFHRITPFLQSVP